MWLRLDRKGSLFRQTYRALRSEILAGRLAPGSRLAPTRTLAGELGVSRNTVLQAYGQLLDEGYLVARTGSGTFVAEILPEERVLAKGTGRSPAKRPPAVPVAPLRPSRYAERSGAAVRADIAWGLPRRRLRYDFRYGEPAFGDLPLETWWRIHARRGRRATPAQLGYGPPSGAPELRKALSQYLSRARAVRCTPEQIIIVHGTQQAIDLVARVLVDPGERVAIEEPNYTGISLALASYGAELVPMPVDDEGLRTEALDGILPVRGIFVTPSHQFPTGAILPLARRLSLLDYAARSGAFVVEDDYDGEYRYDGPPIECLQGLDEHGRAIYLGSASKLLFPALRVGWLIAPDALVPAFARAKALADTGTAALEQLVLAELIDEGHLERHVRRARARNAERRAALAAAIEQHFGTEAVLAGAGAGLHGLVWIPSIPMRREAELRKRCAAEDVGIYPVKPYYRAPPAIAGFVLGFSALEERAIAEGIKRMAGVVAAFK